jgi:hypothetical protein
MAHTDRDDDAPQGIIQQKPPPPPARGPAPDPVPEPIIPQKPPPPPARAPSQDELTPVPSAPAEAAPRRQSSPPASRKPSRKPSGHIVIPARDSDPEIISRAGERPRMSSAPELTLIDYPRIPKPSLTRLSPVSSALFSGR